MSSTRSCFICHASNDFVLASKLVDELESRNWSCWIAPRNITPGSHYPEQINDALCGCDTVVILFSPAANGSKHVLRELEIAVHRSKKIIPLRIGRTEPTASMCYLLASLQWIDTSKNEIETEAGGLASRIISGLGIIRKRRVRRLRVATIVCCAALLGSIPLLITVGKNGNQRLKQESRQTTASDPERWLPQSYLDDIIVIRHSIQHQWQAAMDDGRHGIMFEANTEAYEKLKRIVQQIATAAYSQKDFGTRTAAEVFDDRLDAIAHSGSRRLAESHEAHGSAEGPIADSEQIKVAHEYIAELVRGSTQDAVYNQWIVRWNDAAK